MSEVVLIGPMAHPAMLQALGITGGQPVTLPGRLVGGTRAGIDKHCWPVLQPGSGEVQGLSVPMGAGLARYGAVMGLAPQAHPEARVLGAMLQGPGGVPWNPDLWPADLAAGIAGAVLAAPSDRSPAQIGQRLPMIAVLADSRLRAAATPAAGGGIVGPEPVDGEPMWRIEEYQEPYADFFAVEELRLSHRLHGGGWSPSLKRAGFAMGDAVVVLPWDPARDRVLLVDQFRMAPAMRGDRQPWLLEAIAGRVDAGETPEIAARREAMEEARLRMGELIPAVHHYPSPGAVGEFLYLYVAIADLPDDVAGVHGLDSEAEDIRSHLMSREELARLVFDGQITNGPLAMLALWLEARHQLLRDGLSQA